MRVVRARRLVRPAWPILMRPSALLQPTVRRSLWARSWPTKKLDRNKALASILHVRWVVSEQILVSQLEQQDVGVTPNKTGPIESRPEAAQRLRKRVITSTKYDRKRRDNLRRTNQRELFEVATRINRLDEVHETIDSELAN